MSVLGVRRAATLPLADQEGSEWLALRLGGQRTAAVLPLLRREGGMLLAAPGGAITEEEVEAKSITDVTSDLGLVCQVDVPGFLADGQEVEIPFQLFDWPAVGFKYLRVVTRGSWPPSTLWPRHGEAEVTVDRVSLVESALLWVDEGQMAFSDAYHTAPEAEQRVGTGDDVMQQLLAQMQQTASMVENLRTDLEQVKKGAASVEPFAPPTGPQPSALAKVKALTGPPPRTRALPGAAGVGELPRPEAEELEEDEAVGDGEMQTDQLLKAALVKLLTKGDEKKKKSALTPGLPLHGESESDEEDPLRRLSGAKGTMLLERLRASMEANPGAYTAAIETMAAQVLGETSPNAATMERYAREELPMGSEKSLGYAAWIMTRAISSMKAGHSEKAHLILMLGLAAIEQYRLDGNWVAAWKLTQLSSPPFAEWRARDHYLPQLRADHAHSRLVHSTWMAAVIARLRDEEVLVKRRFKQDTTKNEDTPPQRPGKGRPSGKGQPSEASTK